MAAAAVPQVCAKSKHRESTYSSYPCIARAKHPRGPAKRKNEARTHLCAGNERGGPRAAGAESREHAGRLKTRRILADDVILYAGDDELEGDAKVGSAGFRQLVGFRGAADTEDEPLWKIRIQLTQTRNVGPVNLGRRLRRSGIGQLPLALHLRHLRGRSRGLRQGRDVHDFVGSLPDGLLPDDQRLVRQRFRRHQRALPAHSLGPHHGGGGLPAGLFLMFGGLALAFGCDVWAGHNIIANPLNSVGLLACFGALVSYLYSAPPYKLKAEGWRGSFALGASYIALPWWCGQAMFGHVGEGAAGGELTPPVVVLTVLYSLAGLGIAIVNDFKSIEGDRELGLKSLPVAFGIDGAKYICAGLIDVTQIAVAVYLWTIGLQNYALVLGLLIAPQIWAQTQYLLKDP